MLRALGLTPEQTTTYLRLLRDPGYRPAAGGPGGPGAAVDALAEHGLVVPTAHGWTALPPDVAVEPLIRRREAELAAARRDAAALMDRYRAGLAAAGGEQVVEVITGSAAITDCWQHLLAGAGEEFCGFCREPLLVEPRDAATEVDLLAAGVACRSVWESAGLDTPRRLTDITALADAGEQVRMLPRLPFKLAIADRRRALLPLTEPTECDCAVLVQRSSLLDALIAVFEAHWRAAVPLRPCPAVGAGGDDRLLPLLAAGLTDQSIARHLGVGVRTVQRRVRALMDRLGARNRFQAGLQAARAGLL